MRRMPFLCATNPSADGLRHQQENVLVHVEKENLGKGSLFIAESCVRWVNGAGQGFTVPYQAIALHAVSRDLTAYPHECLYLMIDTKLMPEILQVPSARDSGGSGDSNEEAEDDQAIRELRFIPDDKQALEQMFSVMSDCQTLHPDPEDSDLSEEDYGDEFEDAEEDTVIGDECEEVEGSAVIGQEMQGQHTGSTVNGHIDSNVLKTSTQSSAPAAQDEAMDTGQFADAEMEANN